MVSVAVLAAALAIAGHHPLMPGWALTAVAVAALLEARWPGVWLFLLPASLPLLDFSPWTGWLAFQEFDLLVLAMLAVGHARLAAVPLAEPTTTRFAAPWIAFVALSLVALWRGLDAAQPLHFDWFQSYSDPLNAVRVGKSTLYALLAMPLVGRAFDVAPQRALRRFLRRHGRRAGSGDVGRDRGACAVSRPVRLVRALSHRGALLGNACRRRGHRRLLRARHAFCGMGLVDGAQCLGLGRRCRARTDVGVCVPDHVFPRRLHFRGWLVAAAGVSFWHCARRTIAGAGFAPATSLRRWPAWSRC